VKDYLDRRFGTMSPKTYNGTLGDIKSFFNWCKRKDVGYCADNPAADIRAKPEVYEEPEFVTADTVRSVFRTLTGAGQPERMAPFIRFFALSFFNGIRTDEIMRIRCKDVNLEEGWIRVARPKGFQHGMAPRLFQMMPATKAWLSAHAREAGNPDDLYIDGFVNPSYPRQVLRELAKKNGETIELPDNAGRHSFITMHVALENNFSKTESIAGTSRDMRENHYMGLATKQQAEDYFAVTPETTEK
jgi:integrase